MSDFDEFEVEIEFEDRMKRQMQWVPAPKGFADRVMDRVADRPSRSRLVTMPKRVAGVTKAWRTNWMALAAMLLVGIVLGGWKWRQQELLEERKQAELVQRQFDMAMQVTQRTLIEVQARVGKTVRDSVRQ